MTTDNFVLIEGVLRSGRRWICELGKICSPDLSTQYRNATTLKCKEIVSLFPHSLFPENLSPSLSGEIELVHSHHISTMPHRTRPMAALLLFTGLNVVLVSTITPVYDFVCFHPYWERRREHRRQEREAALSGSASA
ncbi:hypothetical protein K7X08_037295 [Anisodus acutangulus]|uniref:Uncharacterized protein n=1 Tax=Anisodus acutangulus TaxID=402998 RepID=A0A9Q1N0M0_9SOLA|nr:hypothetical protein K7X08_037295 [Anisodus acutangulus]